MLLLLKYCVEVQLELGFGNNNKKKVCEKVLLEDCNSIGVTKG